MKRVKKEKRGKQSRGPTLTGLGGAGKCKRLTCNQEKGLKIVEDFEIQEGLHPEEEEVYGL